MLFIGHFSFDEISPDGSPKHGYFSSIVDAKTPDAAVDKFQDHIKKMKTQIREMAAVVNVYIEEILRVPNIPDTPVITRLQSADGAFPPSISHALPGVDNEDIDAFGLAADVEKHEASSDGGFVESQPFITFEQ
jgi:hypothetical protein